MYQYRFRACSCPPLRRQPQTEDKGIIVTGCALQLKDFVPQAATRVERGKTGYKKGRIPTSLFFFFFFLGRRSDFLRIDRDPGSHIPEHVGINSFNVKPGGETNRYTKSKKT